MGRPRKKEHRNWPDGLLERAKPSGRYYYFRDPDTGKEIPLGKDLKAAIQGVKIVQTRRAVDPVLRVVNAIERPKATVQQHFDWYRTERHAKKQLAATTRDNQGARINKLCRLLGAERAMASLTSGIVNQALDGVSDKDRNRYRALAIEILRSAVARSLIDTNPAEQTEAAVAPGDRERDRLTVEHYQAVHAIAAPWMQRAMELARLSLARPGDLCALTREDWHDGLLRLRVGKTAVRLLIKPHAELKKALDAAHKHQEGDCPLLLSKPANKRGQGGRSHPAALSTAILRDEFARLRDKAGLETTATFYEIKSRGVADYKDAGWPTSSIQALIGHETEAMTEHYDEGHTERWETVDLKPPGKPKRPSP